jgi:hypothetical protein
MLADDTHLTVANAGDSRGVVVTSDGSVRALSTDHKPGDTEGRSRITALGVQLCIAVSGELRECWLFHGVRTEAHLVR